MSSPLPAKDSLPSRPVLWRNFHPLSAHLCTFWNKEALFNVCEFMGPLSTVYCPGFGSGLGLLHPVRTLWCPGDSVCLPGSRPQVEGLASGASVVVSNVWGPGFRV
eukprot:425268-Rhodomonas_salina.1